jgi:uncharacterized phage infection (PIP) family protein YhgE
MLREYHPVQYHHHQPPTPDDDRQCNPVKKTGVQKMKTIEALIKSMHKTAKVNQVISLRKALLEKLEEKKTPSILKAEKELKEIKKQLKNVFHEEISFLEKLENDLKTLNDQTVEIDAMNCTINTVTRSSYKTLTIKETVDGKNVVIASFLNALK